MLTERYVDPQRVVLSWILKSEDFFAPIITGAVNTSGDSSNSNLYGKVHLPGIGNFAWSNPISDSLFKYEFRRSSLDLPQIFGRLHVRPQERVIKHPGILRNVEPPDFDLFRRRGDNLHNVLQLFSSWNFRSSTGRVSGEHSVVHGKFSGDVLTGIPPSSRMRDESNDFDRYSSTISVSTDENLKMSYEFVSFFELFSSLGIFDDSIAEFNSAFSGLNYSHTFPNWPGWLTKPVTISLTLSDLAITYQDDMVSSLAFTYTYAADGSSTESAVRERASVRITIYFVSSLLPSSPPLSDGTYGLDDFMSHTLIVDYDQYYWDYSDSITPTLTNVGVLHQNRFHYSVGSSDWKRCQYIASYPRTDRLTLVNHGYLSGVALTNASSPRGVLPWLYNEPSYVPGSYKNKRLKAFMRAIESDLPDLYPGLTVAQGRALEDGFESIDVNMLETLGDLYEIRSLIEGFGSYRKFLRKLASGNANTLSVLDLLSDYSLLYSFGIAPTISDAQALATHGRRLVESYRLIKPRRALYGHFDFSYDGWTVRYGSKVVIKQDVSSVLAALLPARAAGLIPNLQNVWNLVRFSFVADWFFNIDDRLSVIDNQMMLLLFDVDYVVSTIKATRDVLREDYEPFGFSPSGEDSVKFSYFCRSTSDTLLSFGKSRFDFFSAAGPTDITSAASLAYKLVRGK